MDTNPKSPEKESNSHKVSASKYPGATPAPKAFRVRFKIKGQQDGHVYEGQTKVRECAGCLLNNKLSSARQ